MSTKLADIIVPEKFNEYVLQESTVRNELVQSGIIVPDPALDNIAMQGGKIVTLPFFEDISSKDDEVLSDTEALTPDKITGGSDQAPIHRRGKAFGVSDLAEDVSGDDPMGKIAVRVAEFWNNKFKKVVLASLQGAFGHSSMSNLVHDISGRNGDDAVISPETFLDALYKIGDAKDKITAVAMHSAVEGALIKKGLAVTKLDPFTNREYTSFLNRRILVDDSLPFSSGVYVTYLFGQGAFAFGNGKVKVPVETDRDSLLGEDYLIHRRAFILHPRGVKFTAQNIAGVSPTNQELALASNWERVYDYKNIRILKFVHKVA